MNRPEDALPDHWQSWVRQRAASLSGGKHVRLGADAFGRGAVRLQFEDGSHATFHYAFAVADVERNELAVFTEHCGYHVFRFVGTECDPAPERVTP